TEKCSGVLVCYGVEGSATESEPTIGWFATSDRELDEPNDPAWFFDFNGGDLPNRNRLAPLNSEESALLFNSYRVARDSHGLALQRLQYELVFGGHKISL